jgi:hypothetical protein
MNKAIYDSEIELPENYREHLKVCFQKLKNPDKNSEGYKRNQELQNQRFIGYPQLKRIKNFFDNFKGNQNDSEFVLNGGFEMKNWVDDELRKMREYGHITNRNKMDTGMENQFIKPHEKKDFTNVRPSQEHSKTVDKYNAAVTESLKRINELISKI